MRYIDADLLYRETEKKIKANHECRMAVVDDEFLDLINDAETEDVVPRSEVEKLEEHIDDLNDSKEHLCVMLEEARADVAREIFEEIEKLFGGTTMMWLRTTPWQWEDYEELKKKYVEGKDES